MVNRRTRTVATTAVALIALAAAGLAGPNLFESGMRWPTLFSAVLSAVLIFSCHGTSAAILFVTMPALVAATWIAAPSLLPLPFIVAWLAAMQASEIERRPSQLAMAGAALGLGLYSHYSAVVTMPIYAALGVAALLAAGAPRRALMGLAGGFAMAAIPFAIYLLGNHDYLPRHAAALGLYDTQRFNILQGIKDMASWVGLTARSEAYWNYLDPAFLFLPEGNVIDSVLRPRIFLLPLALLLPVGAFVMMSAGSPYTATLVIGGFLLAPVTAAIAVKAPSAACVILATPFAAIIAAAAIPGVAAFPSRLLAQYQRRRFAVETGDRARH